MSIRPLLALTLLGTLPLAGRVDSATVDCSGSGSADVIVSASERLDVSILGSGEVRYGGTRTVSACISGSGDILPR